MCAEPVTGSSSMPEPGAKKRETKSYSRRGRARGDDHAADRQFAQTRVVGLERAQFGVGLHFHEVVEGVASGEARAADAQRGQQFGGRLGGGGDLGGEIEFDPVAAAVGGQQSAARVEARLGAFGQMAVLPQHVGAGQGGVAAEIHLDRGREPAQVVAVGLFDQEGGFGEVHFARHVAHPLVGGVGRRRVRKPPPDCRQKAGR